MVQFHRFALLKQASIHERLGSSECSNENHHPLRWTRNRFSIRASEAVWTQFCCDFLPGDKAVLFQDAESPDDDVLLILRINATDTVVSRSQEVAQLLGHHLVFVQV